MAATLLTFKTFTGCCYVYFKPHLEVTLQELEGLLNQLPELYVVTRYLNIHCRFRSGEKAA